MWHARQYRPEMVEGFRRAAELGHVDAPYYLALYYKDYGHGGGDYIHAYNWFRKAMGCGCEQAKRFYTEFLYDLAVKARKYGEYRVAVASFEMAAKAGHSDAANTLGVLYAEGEGIAKSAENAVYWYEIAAKSGNYYAMSNLAHCYKSGTGVKKSYHQALHWFERAAERHDREAREQAAALSYQIGTHYLNSKEEQDRPKAFQYYQKAEAYGNQKALYVLGHCLANGIGVQANLSRAAEYYEQAARNGSAPAQNNLGVLYARGEGVEQNDQQAVYYYEQAAQQGHSTAMNNLGVCYKSGKGVEQSAFQALYWFEQAAELGHVEARQQVADGAYYIGEQYMKSKNPNEKGKAFDYFRKALASGNKRASLQLGCCYEYGYGVEQSYKQAIPYYVQAVNEGLDTADHWLSDCYFQYAEEIYKEDNYEEAIELLEQGAALDNGDCMLLLAQCYFEGNGVDSDDVLSAQWVAAAEQAGFGVNVSAEEYYAEVAERCFDQWDYDRGVTWYKRAAERGSAAAMEKLGNLYAGYLSDDYGHEPDYERAIEWYALAVEHDNCDCTYPMEACYAELAEKALSEDNIESALSWYLKAGSRYGEGIHKCYCLLARAAVDSLVVLSDNGKELPDKQLDEELYSLPARYYSQAEEYDNFGTEEAEYLAKAAALLADEDDEQAFCWSKKAAELGHATAQMMTGFYYERGIAASPDEKEAVYWYHQAAEQGDKYAQHALAVMYMEGRGTTADLEKAELLMHDAYLQGYPLYDESDKQLVPLKNLYSLKYGTEYEIRFIAFYERLAELKLYESSCMYYELGLAYETGFCPALDISVEKNADKSFSCYKRAVEAGGIIITEAVLKLADCYRYGLGTRQDLWKAIEVLEDAARWGEPEALNAIGECYFYSDWTGRDVAKTFEYCSKAAEDGYAEAQYNVGFCYEHGYGADQDMQKSLEWYGKSAEQGFALAVERLADSNDNEPVDDRLDVNELIRRMGQVTTKEEKFLYKQAINEKMHHVMYGRRERKELVPYGDEAEEEIREYNLMGNVIEYSVTSEDRITMNIINQHIRIYVPGDTLLIAKSYAREHLSAKAISYAVEKDDVYLWLLEGTGIAVVFELASLLDEEPNQSIMYLKMVKYCLDYLQEFELYGDKFDQAYENNLLKSYS